MMGGHLFCVYGIIRSVGMTVQVDQFDDDCNTSIHSLHRAADSSTTAREKKERRE